MHLEEKNELSKILYNKELKQKPILLKKTADNEKLIAQLN